MYSPVTVGVKVNDGWFEVATVCPVVEFVTVHCHSVGR